jgi:serine phosphatase RsbU (regulator of sigma subunit)
VEAENGAGERFGADRFRATLEGAAPGQRVEAVRQALQGHLAGALPHDDVTLLAVDCCAA